MTEPEKCPHLHTTYDGTGITSRGVVDYRRCTDCGKQLTVSLPR